MELKIEYLPVEALTPYEKNARKHEDKDVKTIVNSIREFGFNDAIGIWSDKNIVVEGHGRLLAAKELGMKEVPCVRLDHLTDEARRAYALAHNKTAEMSEWDLDFMNDEINNIFEIDMSQFGFDIPDEDEEEKEIVEDAEPEEVGTRCKAGDIWEMGNHRLICGDSTDIKTIEKLMNGERADMVFTDPPYGYKYQSNGRVKTDKFEVLKNDDTILDFFPSVKQYCDGWVWVCTNLAAAK